MHAAIKAPATAHPIAIPAAVPLEMPFAALGEGRDLEELVGTEVFVEFEDLIVVGELVVELPAIVAR